MTKLIKNLIIGGTSVGVVGGAGAGVGVALTNKKTSSATAVPVEKSVSKQPTTEVKKDVTSTTETHTVVAPTPIPQEIPMLIPMLVPKQVLPGQLIPMAIPQGIQGQIDPVATITPTFTETMFGKSSPVPPKLPQGTYGIHNGIHHLALDSDMQLIPEPLQAIPQAVPQQVPHLVITPTYSTMFGKSSPVPPKLPQGTYGVHEGIHHLALDSDMQLIPELPAQPVKPQAVPYVVPPMQQEVYKNTLGDPYIQNEWVSYNVATVVWTIDDHQVPYLHQPVAPIAIPPLAPSLAPVLPPKQVLPQQKVPMMINSYAPAASEQSWYSVPYQAPAAPQMIDAAHVVKVEPKYQVYTVPPLKAEVTSEELSVNAIAAPEDVAAAAVLGAPSQPFFQVIRGESKPPVESIRADYHVIEGFNHAETIDGVLQLTPELKPMAVPYLVPTLPVVSTDPSEKEVDADEVKLIWAPTDVEQQEFSTDSSATVTATPHHMYESHSSLVDSLINHLSNHCSIQQAVENVFKEVASGHHQGYEHEDYSNIWETLSHHVSMHQDRSQHVTLTMNDFRVAFNAGFANLRQSMPNHFDVFDHLHSFLLER